MDKKQEEDFYRELDENHLKLNQGCLKVFIFFVLIIVIGGIIVFFLALKLRSNIENLTFSELKVTPSTENVSGSEQEIIVTDSDLNNFIGDNQKNIPIKFLKGNITPEGIIFKGIWQALDTRIELSAYPVIKNSKVTIEVRSVKVGGISVPSWLGGQISSLVEKVISQRLPKNSKPTQITVSNGQLTIKVQNE